MKGVGNPHPYDMSTFLNGLLDYYGAIMMTEYYMDFLGKGESARTRTTTIYCTF